jgi:UDP-glucose 4-epimerase
VNSAGATGSLTWVIGRGGLLGQSLEKAIGEGSDHGYFGAAATAGGRTWSPPEPIDWSAPSAGAVQLRQRARQFLDIVGDRSWSVAWCAGAGVTASSADALKLELAALRETLDALSAPRPGSKGTFFFASSAGGVYAGVREPPYDESSPVRPLAAYGRAKLDGEALVTAWSRQTGTPALIGRIANIYGPGQNLTKAQGLISQICRSQLTGQPLSIYVSLDTLRDYLFAPDCARLIIEGLDLLAQEQSSASGPLVVTKILASQRAITIGAVLGEMRRIFKSSPRIVLGASAVSAFQARDLSLRSRVWPDLDRCSLTPFPVGVAATAADLLRRLQRGAIGGL